MEKLLEQFGATSKERVEKALSTLQQGKGILLVDDENRENEGDIIYPASTITEQDMALLIRECSGIVCLCISEEKVSISTSVRWWKTTIRKIKPHSPLRSKLRRRRVRGFCKRPGDYYQNGRSTQCPGRTYCQPGTCFPFNSQKGGVFERRGHTEGSVDLVKMANLGDDAVLCELTNEDGSMARLPEIAEFAVKKE